MPARLMAIADVFDALSSRRVYKQAHPWDDVRVIMRSERGRHFDPDMLDTFRADFDGFCASAQQLADEPEAARADASAPVAS